MAQALDVSSPVNLAKYSKRKLTFLLFSSYFTLKTIDTRVIISLAKKGGIFMTKVVVRNGNVDGALRNLKAANSKDGSLAQLREKQDGYLKPGVRRRNAKKEGIKNTRRRNRRENRGY